LAELLGVLRPDTDDKSCLYPGSSTPAPATPARLTPICKKKYGISVTLGGSREK
jgi:hypothetical protein